MHWIPHYHFPFSCWQTQLRNFPSLVAVLISSSVLDCWRGLGLFPRQTGHMLVESLYLHAANQFHVCGHEWQSNVLSWPRAICIDNELEINWFWNYWRTEQLALLALICWCNADGPVNTSVLTRSPRVSGDADELHWIWYWRSRTASVNSPEIIKVCPLSFPSFLPPVNIWCPDWFAGPTQASLAYQHPNESL